MTILLCFDEPLKEGGRFSRPARIIKDTWLATKAYTGQEWLWLTPVAELIVLAPGRKRIRRRQYA